MILMDIFADAKAPGVVYAPAGLTQIHKHLESALKSPPTTLMAANVMYINQLAMSAE